MMRPYRLLIALPVFAFPFGIHGIYQPLNEVWTVKRFGCGCPPLKGVGGLGFNANSFNAIAWSQVLISCGVVWWRLTRSDGAAASTKRLLFQWAGLYVLAITCVQQWAREFWL